MWLDLPRHFPHKCHSCHRGGLEASPFFEDDLTYMVWEDGDKRNYRLYTCATCVRAMLSAQGCPMNLNDLQKEVEDLVDESNAIRAELQRTLDERDQIAKELAHTLQEKNGGLSTDEIARKVIEGIEAIRIASGKPRSTDVGAQQVTVAYTAAANPPTPRPRKKP